MAELQVIASAIQGQLSFNKVELKAVVEQEMKKYEIEVTEDNIKEAKDARATLNKVSKALDDKRKELKKKYCEPLVIFENDVKEIKAIVDEGAQRIGIQLNAFDEKYKEEKQLEIAEYFASKDFSLVHLDKLFDQKWLNKTCNDWKEQLDQKVNAINQGLDVINSFGVSDEEKEEIKGYYLDCLNVVQARQTFDSQKERREQLKKLQEQRQIEQESKRAPQVQKASHSEPLQEETPKQVQQVKKQRIVAEFIATREFYDYLNVAIKKYKPQVKIIEKEDIE